jgi:hypothetical protein
VTRHYGRRATAPALSERQRFIARYTSAGVPAAEANATWWRLTRMWRSCDARRITIRQAVQQVDVIMGPLLARYQAALAGAAA